MLLFTQTFYLGIYTVDKLDIFCFQIFLLILYRGQFLQKSHPKPEKPKKVVASLDKVLHHSKMGCATQNHMSKIAPRVCTHAFHAHGAHGIRPMQ